MVGKYLQVIELEGFENKPALLVAGTLQIGNPHKFRMVSAITRI